MVLREVIPELQRGLLPADVHHRSAIIQLVCDRLSAHLQKDTLSASAMDIRWGRALFVQEMQSVFTAVSRARRNGPK